MTYVFLFSTFLILFWIILVWPICLQLVFPAAASELEVTSTNSESGTMFFVAVADQSKIDDFASSALQQSFPYKSPSDRLLKLQTFAHLAQRNVISHLYAPFTLLKPSLPPAVDLALRPLALKPTSLKVRDPPPLLTCKNPGVVMAPPVSHGSWSLLSDMK